MKKVLIVVLIGLISGCSIFKESTKDESINVETNTAKDIVTESIKNTEIEIPADLFQAIMGISATRDTVSKDTSNAVDKPNKPREPVKITIKETTKKQDKSVVKKDSAAHTETKDVVKKESKGIFGFLSGGIIVGVILLVIAGYVVKKFII